MRPAARKVCRLNARWNPRRHARKASQGSLCGISSTRNCAPGTNVEVVATACDPPHFSITIVYLAPKPSDSRMSNPERPAPDHIKIVEDYLKTRADMRGFAERNPAVVDRLGQIVRWVDANLRASGYKLSVEELAPRGGNGWETRFGLTPAEARLAAHLIDGGTTASYADEHGLSPHTVRNHLRSIYAKTNTNRQVSLLQLLLRTSGKNP